jgi:hypothetical protein
MELVIEPTGQVRCVYDETIALGGLERFSVASSARATYRV